MIGDDYFVTHGEGMFQGRRAFYWCVMHVRTKNPILYSPWYWDEPEAIRLAMKFSDEFQVKFTSDKLNEIIKEHSKPKLTLIQGGQ